MRVYIYSDLHLECMEQYNIKDFIDLDNVSNDSILLLCGDVCTLYKQSTLNSFLEIVCKHFKHVLYVPGNGEYYKPNDCTSINFTTLNERLDNLSNLFDNLHILNTESIVINDYLISGCVLWSKISFNLPKFFKISGFTKDLYNRKNNHDIQFIKDDIQYAKDNNLKHIIMTHYPPSKSCLKEFEGNDTYKRLYYNELDELFENKLVWVYGHSHYNIDKQLQNTRLVSNQYGKYNNKDPNFSNNFYII
jgi:predicted phosphohydrolase